MNRAEQPIRNPREILYILMAYPRRWLVPAIVVSVLAGLYAAFGPATWEASQALIIRNEAANNQERPGKFAHADEMKTVQETILELVKSRGVLEAALATVGPAAGSNRSSDWPGAQDVAQLRDCLKLVPPKGAEFGKTEIFYLKVRDYDRQRAVALNTAICRQLQTRFQELRDAKARSMIDELHKTVNLAKADLDESTARLAAIEKHFGSDLAELRFLHDSTSSDSALHRTLTEIRGELRQAETAQQADRELLALLQAAQDDPGRLLATPSRLLESQPALRRLKEGLVDAQLRTAQFRGRMSEQHPLVRAAKQAEEEIAQHLHDELALAVRGLEVESRLNTDRVAMLQTQLAKVTGQLAELAEARAAYSNLTAETNHRETLLQRAEQDLAEARAAQASAKASSLIGSVDAPDTGVDPVGPSPAMIVLAGIAGGLLLGLAVLMLTMQDVAPPAAATSSLEDSLQPAWQPGGNLSLRRALQKIGNGHSA